MSARSRDKTELLAALETPGRADAEEADPIPDERLSLIFACCHPALSTEAQVALTLRAARRADAPRRSRAPSSCPSRRWPSGSCARSGRSGRPESRSACPPDHLLPERLRAVLAVLYLIFNEGYGDRRRARELCDEAIRLGEGARAADARRAGGARPARADAPARRAPRGAARRRAASSCCSTTRTATLWDGARDRARAGACSSARCRCAQPGPYQLQAAIASLHLERRDRLAADRRALRAARAASRRRRSSSSTAPWRWRWPRGRSAGLELIDRIDGLDALPPPALGPRRSAAPARPQRRGGRGLRAGARARRRSRPSALFLKRRLAEVRSSA